jgi:hypothetical protein
MVVDGNGEQTIVRLRAAPCIVSPQSWSPRVMVYSATARKLQFLGPVRAGFRLPGGLGQKPRVGHRCGVRNLTTGPSPRLNAKHERRTFFSCWIAVDADGAASDDGRMPPR